MLNDLRVVDDDLAIGVPAGNFEFGVLAQVCDGVTADCWADSAFGFVLCFRVLNGKVLLLRLAAAVCEVGRVCDGVSSGLWE